MRVYMAQSANQRRAIYPSYALLGTYSLPTEVDPGYYSTFVKYCKHYCLHLVKLTINGLYQ